MSEQSPLEFNGQPYEMLGLAQLRFDDSFQVRDGLSKEKVQDYCEIIAADYQSAELEAGSDPQVMNHFAPTLPPIPVFRDPRDGTLRPAGGAHRYQGYKENNLVVLPCFIKEGGYKDAKWFALGDNARHGLPLKPAEKRVAVLEILDDINWKSKTDREIARHVGVSHPFVGAMRAACEAAFESGEYTADGVRKLIRLCDKADRDLANQLRSGQITPREAEELLELRERKRAEEAPAREAARVAKVDAARIEAAQSEGQGGNVTTPDPESPASPLERSAQMVSDEDYMNLVPAYGILLGNKAHKAAQRLRVDALHWRSFEEGGLMTYLNALVNEQLQGVASGHDFCDALRSVANIPHPCQWHTIMSGQDYSVQPLARLDGFEALPDEDAVEPEDEEADDSPDGFGDEDGGPDYDADADDDFNHIP